MRFWLRALLGAVVVGGIAIAGLSYAYWDETVLIASMAINYVRYWSAPAGTLETEVAQTGAAVQSSTSPVLASPRLRSPVEPRFHRRGRMVHHRHAYAGRENRRRRAGQTVVRRSIDQSVQHVGSGGPDFRLGRLDVRSRRRYGRLEMESKDELSYPKRDDADGGWHSFLRRHGRKFLRA